MEGFRIVVGENLGLQASEPPCLLLDELGGMGPAAEGFSGRNRRCTGRIEALVPGWFHARGWR
jgi:hypothetical protein